jgi:hypothetical protein
VALPAGPADRGPAHAGRRRCGRIRARRGGHRGRPAPATARRRLRRDGARPPDRRDRRARRCPARAGRPLGPAGQGRGAARRRRRGRPVGGRRARLRRGRRARRPHAAGPRATDGRARRRFEGNVVAWPDGDAVIPLAAADVVTRRERATRSRPASSPRCTADRRRPPAAARPLPRSRSGTSGAGRACRSTPCARRPRPDPSVRSPSWAGDTTSQDLVAPLPQLHARHAGAKRRQQGAVTADR